MPATLTKLVERVTSTGRHRVDRERGVIYGVRIIGRESKNGRIYTESALRKAVGLYEGCKVCIDHTMRHDANTDRSMKDFLGTLRNVEYRAGAVYADLHLLTSHTMAGLVLEAAEKMPTAFGLSHHAEGKVVRKNGKAVVEDVEKVFSVDVVMDPATNRGLFESMCHDRIGHLKQQSRQRRLRENGEIRPDMMGADLTAEDVDQKILDVVRSRTMSLERKLREIERLILDYPALKDDDETDPVLDPPEPAETAESFAATLKGQRIVEANSPARAGFVKSITETKGGYRPRSSATTGTGRNKLRESSRSSRSATLPKPAADAKSFAKAVKR